MELIKTLQALTEGKIYVEIERARLTRQLARMKEAEGAVQEAAEILQEVAVVSGLVDCGAPRTRLLADFNARAETERIADTSVLSALRPAPVVLLACSLARPPARRSPSVWDAQD